MCEARYYPHWEYQKLFDSGLTTQYMLTNSFSGGMSLSEDASITPDTMFHVEVICLFL